MGRTSLTIGTRSGFPRSPLVGREAMLDFTTPVAEYTSRRSITRLWDTSINMVNGNVHEVSTRFPNTNDCKMHPLSKLPLYPVIVTPRPHTPEVDRRRDDGRSR